MIMRSRQLPVLFLASLCLFSGCRMRQGRPQAAEAGPEAVQEAPVIREPVFQALSIPTETEARMRGVSYPEGAEIQLSELRYLKLSYVDFDGEEQVGEMICNQAIAQDLLDIFRALYEARYPIRSIRTTPPVSITGSLPEQRRCPSMHAGWPSISIRWRTPACVPPG